jgi:O-antigen/teichoic acid export membrane protein
MSVNESAVHPQEASDLGSPPPPPVSWGRRFARGAAWSVVATAMSYASSILAFLITARFLGAGGFGEFGIVTSTSGMFGVLAGMGLGLTATKYVAELRDTDAARAGRIVALTLLATVISSAMVCVALVGAAGWLARGVLNAPHVADALRLSALVLLFSAIANAQNGVLSGFEQFRMLARNNAIRGAVAVPVQFVVVWRWGLAGAVVGMAATNALACVMNHRSIASAATSAGVPVKWRGVTAEWPVLWHFALPAAAASLIAVPMQWLTNALLAQQAGGFVQLGYLNAAYNWRALVTFLPLTIASAALPALASLRSSAASNGTEDGVELANAANQIVLWPVAVGTMLLAGQIMRSYGGEFVLGRAVFITLIGGTAIGYVGNVLGTLVLSEGRTRFALLQNGTFGITLLALVAAGVSRYEAMAVAGGTAIAYLLLLLGTIAYMRARGLLSRSLGRRLAFGGVLMAAVTLVISRTPLALGLWLFVPGVLLAGLVSVAFISPRLRDRGLNAVRGLRFGRLRASDSW